MKQIKNTLFIVVGTSILAFGISVFILPHNLVVGGVSGLAIVIEGIILHGIISVDALVSVLSWAFFIIGVFTLGISFAAKTLLSTVIYTTLVPLFSYLSNTFFFEREGTGQVLFATLGGIFVGVGCALTFIGGGSTGGVDIVALMLCKYFPRLKTSAIIFITDFTVVLLGAFAVRNFALTLLGVLSACACAVSMWFVLLLSDFRKD